MLSVDSAVDGDATSTVAATHQAGVQLFAARTYHVVAADLLRRNIQLHVQSIPVDHCIAWRL